MKVRFFCFWLEIRFLCKFDPKKSKLSVSAEIWYPGEFEYAEFNGGVHFCFRLKIPFWANLVQKIKIASLSWGLVPRVFGIQWWCSLFSVLDWKYPFWANLVQKIKTFNLSWNLLPRLIRVCRIQWWCSLFLFFTVNILLGQI